MRLPIEGRDRFIKCVIMKLKIRCKKRTKPAASPRRFFSFPPVHFSGGLPPLAISVRLLFAFLVLGGAFAPPVFGAGGRATVVEVKRGERMSDLARRLESRGLTTRAALLAVAASDRFAAYPLVPPPRPSLSRFEGLFPVGRFDFPADSLPPPRFSPEPARQAEKNAAAIVDRLLREAAAYDRTAEGGSLPPYDNLILASIVQKEAVAGVDYGKISSVFHNRLRQGITLSSCPAVEYALGYHRPFLTLGDLRIDSPYNLYRRKGLPPTPICFFTPGALRAAVAPPSTHLLFFVFDWTTGKLSFSRAYPEHQRQVKRAVLDYIKAHGRAALRKISYDKFYHE